MERLPSLGVRHDASYRDFALKSTRVAEQNTSSVRQYARHLCRPHAAPCAWLSGLREELGALIGLPQASHHLSAMRPRSRDSYFYHRECKSPLQLSSILLQAFLEITPLRVITPYWSKSIIMLCGYGE